MLLKVLEQVIEICLIEILNDLPRFNSWVGKFLWRMDRLPTQCSRASLRICQWCKTWIQSLSWGDPLEEGMATHSSTFAWRHPRDRRARRGAACGAAKSQTWLRDSQLSTVDDLMLFLSFMIMLSSVWIAGCNVINLEVEKSVRRIFLAVLMKDSVTFELWRKCRQWEVFRFGWKFVD